MAYVKNFKHTNIVYNIYLSVDFNYKTKCLIIFFYCQLRLYHSLYSQRIYNSLLGEV